MKLKLSLPTSNKGFTIIELLVSLFLGLIMVSIAISTVLSGRQSYQTNLITTRMSQNIRGSLDILGTNIKQAGERMPGDVPAIELIDGASGTPDQLIVRRSLIGEALKLCQPIFAGTSSRAIFGDTSTTPGCDYASQDAKLDAWRNKRLSSSDPVYGYIIDTVTKTSEIFEYHNELKTGSQFNLQRAPASGNWQNNYTVGNTVIYLLEQWSFSLQADPILIGATVLSVTANNDSSNILHLAPGITDLQIEIELKDGNIVQSFAPTDDWSEIKNISVTIAAEDSYKGKVYQTELNSKFFPRNILSL